MLNDENGEPWQNAEDASLASAGEPHRESEAQAGGIEDAAPIAEELDRRERRLTRPRKPMGPSSGVEPTTPDEPS